jgi:membrane-bound ClpP family serine protease
MSKNKIDNTSDAAFALGKENYKLLIIGFAIIVLGFLLMIGGGSDDPTVFSYDIFSFRRITLAPMVILAGMIFEIYAIMKKPKGE